MGSFGLAIRFGEIIGQSIMEWCFEDFREPFDTCSGLEAIVSTYPIRVFVFIALLLFTFGFVYIKYNVIYRAMVSKSDFEAWLWK